MRPFSWVPECGWLDAKSGIHLLDDPAGAEELVKGVAGFANTTTGGLLLVGFSTRKEHDREILDQVRPVPRALVDLDRHRMLIRERGSGPLGRQQSFLEDVLGVAEGGLVFRRCRPAGRARAQWAVKGQLYQARS